MCSCVVIVCVFVCTFVNVYDVTGPWNRPSTNTSVSR